MEGTRSKIMDILRRRHEATVEELTKALDLAPATVRRHLDILQRDGYVKVRPVRRETGRPHYAFSMTEAAEQLFPQHYVRITNRLIEEIMALAPEDTSGKSGKELAGVIFERMTERLARTYGPRVNGATLAERVQQATHLLANEGLNIVAQPESDGFLLMGRGCPCRRLSSRDMDACAHDQKLLSALLRAEVEPASGANGDGYCAYYVRDKRSERL